MSLPSEPYTGGLTLKPSCFAGEEEKNVQDEEETKRLADEKNMQEAKQSEDEQDSFYANLFIAVRNRIAFLLRVVSLQVGVAC